MLKTTRTILLILITGNILTISAMYQRKDTLIVLPDSTGSKSLIDFNTIFNPEQYEIITIHKPITTFKWLTDYQYRQNIDEAIKQVEETKPFNNIIFFASKRITPFALHYIAQNHMKISGVLLENPTYDPDYPISGIAKKIPKNIPVVIYAPTKEQNNNSKLIYTSLAPDRNNTISHDVYFKSSPHDSGLLEVQIITLLQPNKCLTLSDRQKTQPKPTDDEIENLHKIITKETQQYRIQFTLLTLCGSSLLFYILYRIGALNKIFIPAESFTQ